MVATFIAYRGATWTVPDACERQHASLLPQAATRRCVFAALSAPAGAAIFGHLNYLLTRPAACGMIAAPYDFSLPELPVTDTQAPLILTEVKDRVMTIRLNRADKKNALTQGMYTAMEQAVTEAAGNPEVRVVLFVGSGGSFCAGNDLQDFLKLDHNTPREQNPVLRFMHALAALAKPVVAAVQGPAIGIGATMLFHCDLVYAGQNARFQFPFVNIGICAEFASTYLLPRIVGHVKASELLLFGEPFTAAVAEASGIVNSVHADDEVEAHALARALKLACQPPNALRVNKMLLKRWRQAEVSEAIPLEADHFIPMLRQPEAIEAMTAFIAKRKPDFSKFN